MNRSTFSKLLVIPLSIWLPLANVPRILRAEQSGRNFAVGVAGLRRYTSSELLPCIPLQNLAAIFGVAKDYVAVNIPCVDVDTVDQVGGVVCWKVFL